jgi:hypothetical protein
MDWLISVLPAALVIAVEYDADQCDADDLRSFMEIYAEQVCCFVGFDVRERAGDPSLVADWNSP